MYDNKSNIIYRVDGGRVWGVSMGHVKRALISATKLAKNYNIIFIMKNYPEGVQYVRQEGFFVETIDQLDDTDQTLIKFLEQYSPKKVIFDLRSNPYKNFFTFARNRNIETIVFDITGDLSGQPDIIINDSFVPEFTSYISDLSVKYIGPQYFLSDSLPKVPRINKKMKNIAVTMGGSDPAGLTKKIVQSLIKSNVKKKFTIILGPLFPEKEEKDIRAICERKKFKVVRNPSNFIDLLSKQDLVITAAGRTLYECSYMGCPILVVPSIEHEEKTAKKYNELTGCSNIGLWNAGSDQKIQNEIYKYEDFDFRKRLSALGQNLIDDKACSRIMDIII